MTNNNKGTEYVRADRFIDHPRFKEDGSDRLVRIQPPTGTPNADKWEFLFGVYIDREGESRYAFEVIDPSISKASWSTMPLTIENLSEDTLRERYTEACEWLEKFTRLGIFDRTDLLD